MWRYNISVAEAPNYQLTKAFKFTDGDILQELRQCGTVTRGYDMKQYSLAVAPIVPSLKDFVLKKNTTFAAFAMTTAVDSNCGVQSAANWDKPIRQGISNSDKAVYFGYFNRDISRIVSKIYSNFNGTAIVYNPVLEWQYVDEVIEKAKRKAYLALSLCIASQVLLYLGVLACFAKRYFVCHLCEEGVHVREDSDLLSN